jgi:protein SCO1
MRRRILIAVLVLVVAAPLAFAIFQPIQVLPRIRLAPGFSLIDQDGNRVTSEDMRGSFVLYDFTYSQCPEPCANLDATMRQVQDRVGEIDLGDVPLRLVTISFDPERDTQEVLLEKAQAVGADPAVWQFATVENPSLLKTIIGGGFEDYYAQNEDGSFTFDPKFVLVDGWGTIRGEYQYRSSVPEADRIIRHIGVLSDEVQKSTGAASVAYEAAHLFLCYAK